MTAFDGFIDRLLAHEGGYINHPKDPGGETNFGISKRAYPNVNIATLTRDQAKAIYKRDYWDAVMGDHLPPAIAFHAFDVAVNHGKGQAIRWLQRAAGVADDGRLGNITLAAIQCMSPSALLLRFNAERLEFYTNLGSWDTFGKGWTRRVAGNLRYAAEDTK